MNFGAPPGFEKQSFTNQIKEQNSNFAGDDSIRYYLHDFIENEIDNSNQTEKQQKY